MEKIYKAEVFQSVPQRINCGEIVNINIEVDICTHSKYYVIDGVLNNSSKGTYVVELIQLHKGTDLNLNKYVYLTSCGEKSVKYGFSFEPSNLTTNFKVNIYKVVE